MKKGSFNERAPGGADRQRRTVRGLHPVPVSIVGDNESPAVELRGGASTIVFRSAWRKRCVGDGDAVPGDWRAEYLARSEGTGIASGRSCSGTPSRACQGIAR